MMTYWWSWGAHPSHWIVNESGNPQWQSGTKPKWYALLEFTSLIGSYHKALEIRWKILRMMSRTPLVLIHNYSVTVTQCYNNWLQTFKYGRESLQKLNSLNKVSICHLHHKIQEVSPNLYETYIYILNIVYSILPLRKILNGSLMLNGCFSVN